MTVSLKRAKSNNSISLSEALEDYVADPNCGRNDRSRFWTWLYGKLLQLSS
ncbi:hypothetical protein [Nostoc sp. UHCC 0252]|uniref:hypothetical protein n=1 Tax=Nostoc sp. UHCC 0252 TaxID=3110241 RepID=UPI002B200C3F|nr:hypothetical protein [Nostoc sp. UHCC 0252]MEA5603854.1 hypothetical protein [Nostoc sp. UHCC 0252]